MLVNEALKRLMCNVGCWLALALVIPPVAAAQSPSRQVGLERTGANTFSIDVDNADIRTVARAIGEFAGKNVIVARDVKATVSVHLSNVEWDDALRSVLRSAGLDYIDEGGIIRIDQGARLQGEIVERETARNRALEVAPLETRIVRLNYANASELASSVNAGLTRRGTIMVEKRTNSLIITDLPEKVDAVERMAISLDSTTPQIEITAKLVDVDAEALRELGIQWGMSGLTPGGDDDNTLGFEVDTPGPGGPPRATASYGLIKDWGALEVSLQMLEQHRKANIISNPRITTVDNREAKIVVGQKIPLIVQDVAGNPVSQLQTIGIQLTVTPHLTQDKKIIMDLHPEVSDLAAQSTVQGGVIINTSEADTRVMVDDGQTAVIGGLIRTNESTVRRGVPVLKDMPLLGYLFRSTSQVRQNRELIIFVTPRVVAASASN
jgi:type IV pilus assembly protein PilQ